MLKRILGLIRRCRYDGKHILPYLKGGFLDRNAQHISLWCTMMLSDALSCISVDATPSRHSVISLGQLVGYTYTALTQADGLAYGGTKLPIYLSPSRTAVRRESATLVSRSSKAVCQWTDSLTTTMGNCGSSLDCAACGNIRNGGKCAKDLKFNADIAGIGETDQHALKLLKKPFKRDKRHVGAETPIPIQMSRRQGRSDVLVSFIKMLSDQQLITGLSILIAALSSQCVISQREWHIVTSLAYFSATTHSLSLDVLRNYLVEHIWVRYCRITFTLIFLVFFTFAFLVDHLPAWQDQIVHCLLLDWRSQPGLLQISILMINVVPVLIILWGKHLSAMARLIAPEAIHHRHVTTTMVDRMSMYFWSWTNNISISESANIVADARRLYGIAIRPSNTQTRISVWYFLEQYHEAYLSELPVWAFQFAYGTTNTIQAVWGVDAWGTDVEDETTTLGFGQVVAIGLLVLPLITLTELVNGEYLL
ncbi:hypothetical protein IG631_22713 [Alternaria alternata]|nr:hypothetical protein IG631_22713 [Alternaria alternata]